ncbi:MAG: TetR/AcrR family transcriptional regulator [Anaerolineae bacterium]
MNTRKTKNPLLTRHERRKARTRRRLLDAARVVIARSGYDTASVRDITDEADVSKATFYLHFKDKEALTRTLILEGFDALRAELDASLAATAGPAPDPHERLRNALSVVFRYAAANRDLFGIMLGRQASAELNLMALEYFTATVTDLLVRYADILDQQEFLPDLLANFVTGAGVRLGMWWIEDGQDLTPEQMADIMYRLLAEGMLGISARTNPSDSQHAETSERQRGQ